MRRIAILALAAALVGSTAALALADDAIEPEDETTRELNDAQQRKVELFAGYFGDYLVGDGEVGDGDEEAAVDEITLLRTEKPTVGWGAMFKLLRLAELRGESLSAILEDIGDEGWAFGKRFKEVGDDAIPLAEDAPKNLGQLKKQNREPKTNNGKKP